eukprot:TRINITY_DN7598_c0_g1_i1.p1 TRINITY_DN7598_c0_g1~~TRINITY_DN7598_c0_g1_i1.p1  ORF type:complete len:190 (-),score=14.93 TRINITY_DN7598_c0_g1_i1:408-977(-)
MSGNSAHKTVPYSTDLLRGRIETTTKNTFIHMSDSDGGSSERLVRSKSDPSDLSSSYRENIASGNSSGDDYSTSSRVDSDHKEVPRGTQADLRRDLEYDGPIPPPSFSVGSDGHDEGTCKPCAWNWKPQGCVKGRVCDFCHLCDEGALKRKKQKNIRRMHQLRKSRLKTESYATSSSADGEVETFKISL